MEASEYRDAGSQAKVKVDANPKGEASEHMRTANTEEVEDKTATRDEIFKNFLYDYKKAKEAKTIIEEDITKWNEAYDAEQLGNEKKNRSRIVMRDISKQLEWQKPNITEPFTASDQPIRAVPMNPKSVAPAKIAAGYLNHEFTTNFDRVKFMNDVADIFGREGTVWVRTGWEFEEEIERVEMNNITIQDALNLPQDPDEITDNGDGTFNVVLNVRKVIKNNPTAHVCKNEDVFPDPGADSKEKMNFLAYRYDQTISELRSAGIYDEEAINRVIGKIARENNDTALGAHRQAVTEDAGKDDYYQSKDPIMQRVDIVEYWGYADMDGDGIAEPVVATWVEKYEVLLRLEENPLPGKNIPFHSAAYSSVPFSLWGRALAYFIMDNQKIRSSIMRGVIDNMSLANNGQKFFKKGMMDYTNWKRMTNGERYIQVNGNPAEAVMDGSFNNLPPSVFNVMDLVTNETQELSGISSSGPGLDTIAQGKTASGVATQTTMAQQRMADAVRNLGSMMKGVFEDWLDLGKEFIEPEQIVRMFGQYVPLSRDDLKGDYNISLRVDTEMNRQTQIQQLNLLLQQSQALGEKAPPQALNLIVAEMMDLFNKPALAEAYRTYQPKPDPMQQQMMQLELQDKQADIAKKIAEAEKLRVEAKADGMYKMAQSREKLAKADQQDMETILKPQEHATDVSLKNKELELNMIQSMISGGKDNDSQNPR